MQTLAEILAGDQAGGQPTPSGASTPNREGISNDGRWHRASEILAAGYNPEQPPPEAVQCEFCGRALEHTGIVLSLMGATKIVWSAAPERCTCPQAAAKWERADLETKAQKAEEARQQRERNARAKTNKLLAASHLAGRFQNRTFERWQMTPENKRAFGICKRYADSFDLMLPGKSGTAVTPPQKERNGLFLVGGYGTGKTHLAAAIANRLIESGTPVVYQTMIDLLARLRETYDRKIPGTEAEVMNIYTRTPLLIIDDLGSEQPTEWGSTMIFTIVNARYEAYRPIVVTSNCGVDELVQRMTPKGTTDRNAQKTVDRLREMCIAVQMDWPSWRSK